jgi:hypothetical protein
MINLSIAHAMPMNGLDVKWLIYRLILFYLNVKKNGWGERIAKQKSVYQFAIHCGFIHSLLIMGICRGRREA